MQCLAESLCYLVHYCLRDIAGGIAAEQSEHARTAQVSLQAGLAGDDVEVNVLKAFRFGEQRHIGLAAADHIPQRGADSSEQWSQIRGFIGGQVIERDSMTARDKHQPAGQRRAECVGNAPSRAQVDPLSCRQICPRIVGAAHALLVSRHEPHCFRNGVPAATKQEPHHHKPANTGATDLSRRAPPDPRQIRAFLGRSPTHSYASFGVAVGAICASSRDVAALAELPICAVDTR
jgi:hypothetical protein